MIINPIKLDKENPNTTMWVSRANFLAIKKLKYQYQCDTINQVVTAILSKIQGTDTINGTKQEE